MALLEDIFLIDLGAVGDLDPSCWLGVDGGLLPGVLAAGVVLPGVVVIGGLDLDLTGVRTLPAESLLVFLAVPAEALDLFSAPAPPPIFNPLLLLLLLLLVLAAMIFLGGGDLSLFFRCKSRRL